MRSGDWAVLATAVVALFCGACAKPRTGEAGLKGWEPVLISELPGEARPFAVGLQGDLRPLRSYRAAKGEVWRIDRLGDKGPESLVFDHDGKLVRTAPFEEGAKLPGDAGAVGLLPDPKEVRFGRDIHPILTEHCATCHSVKEPEHGVELESGHASAAKWVKPADPAGSVLYRSLFPGRGYDAMPPEHRLTDRDLLLIRNWIAGGARND